MHEDGLVFAQAGSSKLLFVQLPLEEGDCCGAFLFGSHAGMGVACSALMLLTRHDVSQFGAVNSLSACVCCDVSHGGKGRYGDEFSLTCHGC